MREIIGFLEQIADMGGCLVIQSQSGLITVFEDYTYKNEDNKIIIEDDEEVFVIDGDIKILNHTSNSLQISTSNGIIGLNLL